MPGCASWLGNELDNQKLRVGTLTKYFTNFLYFPFPSKLQFANLSSIPLFSIHVFVTILYDWVKPIVWSSPTLPLVFCWFLWQSREIAPKFGNCRYVVFKNNMLLERHVTNFFRLSLSLSSSQSRSETRVAFRDGIGLPQSRQLTLAPSVGV